jgi:hypothetical protein
LGYATIAIYTLKRAYTQFEGFLAMDMIIIKCTHAESKSLVSGYQAYKKNLPLGFNVQTFPDWVKSSAFIGAIEAQKYYRASK